MTASGRTIGAPDGPESLATGVWTLAGDRLIIAERGGPATIVVPTEQVRLLAVDLPLPSRARRLEALPFAVEELIAEPVESVHLALGDEVAPRRYLAGVVRHELMAAWVEQAEEAGLGHAAMVPDALALPRPAEGEWSVDLGPDRAVVRAGDGTGFAIPPAMLQAAWQVAGRPAARSYGAPLPDEMLAGGSALGAAALSERLLAPALDLRQGRYARRRAALPNIWRRLGWIVALGAAAHIVIATADTLMLRSIADRREADTRALAAVAAPGANLGGDLAAGIADLLPTGSSAPPDAFLPLLTRVSGALGPLAGSITVRAINYEANALTLDLDGSDPGLVGRVEAALRGSRVPASVTRSPDGSIRITANNA
ncbi:type II secretion system protein GspL [Sphingomonas psychrotolerans]|uniref:Type II secretion system protein GspL n=1 Tax=Sphingomonas psychrotolerans TaxID=1327635 RepID=A0ABU3MXR8_9SPHN|nr:type II secretion system protein GspL [Sphingomonas psychrotolerans]MDT8757114.1 type II secretion system protein GspL [Sphingomonas psychrotolerans]